MGEIDYTTEEDADTICQLLKEAGWGDYSEYQVKGFLKSNHSISLKSVVNNRIIGGLGVMMEDDNSATLEYLVIHKDYRKNGHASKLINALLEEAKKLGVDRIGLDTLEPKYYERFGFREVGRFPNWEDGKDKVFMYREI